MKNKNEIENYSEVEVEFEWKIEDIKDDVLVFERDFTGKPKVWYLPNRFLWKWFFDAQSGRDCFLENVEGKTLFDKLKHFLAADNQWFEMYSVQQLELDENLVDHLKDTAENYGVRRELVKEIEQFNLSINLNFNN